MVGEFDQEASQLRNIYKDILNIWHLHSLSTDKMQPQGLWVQFPAGGLALGVAFFTTGPYMRPEGQN